MLGQLTSVERAAANVFGGHDPRSTSQSVLRLENGSPFSPLASDASTDSMREASNAVSAFPSTRQRAVPFKGGPLPGSDRTARL